jgi:serine/threonine-protein kinase
MAEVWEGRDDVLSRPVAVKILYSHLTADPQIRERFRREAVMAARLVHPGIVSIFDAGVESPEELSAPAGADPRHQRARPDAAWPGPPSTAFIVMELVPGETLRDLIARCGPLPVPLAVDIAAQVADALAYAHARGLVHRDIKPANVLLGDDDGDEVRVKVADFGIAKATAYAADLTANGTVLGTPKYMSPEQVEGREPDARGDLYSLGVVLFEMLAGRPPFEGGGSDIVAALAHVQRPVPSLDQCRADLPEELSELVASLLVKNPDHRLSSATDLGVSLAAVQSRLEADGAGSVLLPPGGRSHHNRSTDTWGADGWSTDAGSEGTIAVEDARASTNLDLGPGDSARIEASASDGATLRSEGWRSEGGSGTSALTVGALSEASRGGGAHRRALAGPIGHRRRFRGPTLLVGLLVVAGCLATLALVRGPQPGAPSRNGPGPTSPAGIARGAVHSLRVLSVHEMAEGWNRPDDNLAELDNVIGSNPLAVWESAQYQGPDFGGSGGFGLVLQLGGEHVVHDLDVTSTMRGWSAEAFVSGTDAPTLAGWGDATSRASGIEGDHTFSLGGRTGSWVLFWIVSPGPSWQAVVGKVTVS